MEKGLYVGGRTERIWRRAFYEALKRRADIRGMNMRAARVEGKPLTTVLPDGLGARAQAGIWTALSD